MTQTRVFSLDLVCLETIVLVTTTNTEIFFDCLLTCCEQGFERDEEEEMKQRNPVAIDCRGSHLRDRDENLRLSGALGAFNEWEGNCDAI